MELFEVNGAYQRLLCSACGYSRCADGWNLTEHWLRDHKSHITDAQVAHILRLSTPIKPQICQNCKWPASIGTLCMVCWDMVEAIMPQVNLMREHEIWRRQRLERKAGLL